jgi:CBS domain containing-hemolysin-like protein
MVERVFELDDISVREVMVPRPDVVSVEADTPLPELRSLVVDSGHTRYPVFEPDDADQVVGFLDVKDVLRAIETLGGEDTADTKPVTAGDLARDMPLIPETGQVNDLLTLFQSEQSQMAAVIDEWGAFEGLVTVEDVVEQIVGDIRDEFDVDEPDPTVERRADGAYGVDGRVVISDLEAELDTEFETREVGTVGGLVLDRLGRAPAVDDSVEVDGYRVTVEAVDGARIARVEVVETGEDGDETPSVEDSG